MAKKTKPGQDGDNVVDRKDILQEIIKSAGEEGLTAAQLQMATFMVSEELEGKLPDDFYKFEPSDFATEEEYAAAMTGQVDGAGKG